MNGGHPNPLSQLEDEILKQSQNAMAPNHDRPLRGLPLFLQNGLPHIREMTLRIIDVGSSGPTNTIDMHIFGPNAKDGIFMDLAICAWGDRVALLIPSPETAPGAWARWRDCFHNVYTYEWMDWRGELVLLPSAIIPPERNCTYNHSTDGLARWPDEDVSVWLHSVRLGCEALPAEWARQVSGSDTPPCEVGPFTLMGPMFEFYKTGRQRVCEWRPWRYTAAGILSDGGLPATFYGVTRPHIQQIMFPQVMMHQRGDIFLLIGQVNSQSEIDEMKRDVEFLCPRYTIVITPEWIQGLRPADNYWSCQTLADSATLGDVCAARWWVYGTNGIASDSFRVRLMDYDIRVLHHAYQLAGVPCSQDPQGHVSIMGVPHSIGTSVVITQLDGRPIRSRHSHVPCPSMAVFEAHDVHWPLVAPEQRMVSIGKKIVILGRRPTLGLAESLVYEDAEYMMDSYYPMEVDRQSLWAAKCHFEAGHFPPFFVTGWRLQGE